SRHDGRVTGRCLRDVVKCGEQCAPAVCWGPCTIRQGAAHLAASTERKARYMHLKIMSLRLLVRPLVSAALAAASVSGVGCSDSEAGKDNGQIPSVEADGAPPGIGAANPSDGPRVSPTPGEGPAAGTPPPRATSAASLA